METMVRKIIKAQTGNIKNWIIGNSKGHYPLKSDSVNPNAFLQLSICNKLNYYSSISITLSAKLRFQLCLHVTNAFN